ncbi:MAG: hypothetical protein EBS19_16175, partial [Spirochaetia bacterium]|nr:hypothetical protein [Spirochaetia bacterium]
IDDVSFPKNYTSSDLTYLKPYEPKEAFFEQVPTKLLSSPFKILTQEIFESLSEEGFLQEEEKKRLESQFGDLLEEVLYQIQTITGLGFQDRVDFWIHLLEEKNQRALAIKVLKNYKMAFLSGDFKSIAIKEMLSLEQFRTQVLNTIKALPWGPRLKEYKSTNSTRIDAIISFQDEKLDLSLSDPTPSFSLNQILETNDQRVKEFYKPYLKEISCTIEGLKKRSDTLQKVLRLICFHQTDYLNFSVEDPLPLDPEILAQKLCLHPTTIARAIKDKVILTPRGVKTLKDLVKPQEKILDKQSILKRLLSLVKSEDKTDPLSDQKLQKLLEKSGSKISRRTISKYRAALKIPDARRRYFN